jgi:8-oxo-dGTP pyrophosphatase MutT (NUDIX family)
VTQAKRWREIRRQRLLDCRIFDVERSEAESPVDGSIHDFYRVRSTDWVQIIPLTAADQLVMVRQYRHGSSSVTLEIPGGLIDPGEDPGDAAIRECLEETGYQAATVHPLGAINPNPAIHAHKLYSFFARDVRKVADIQNTSREYTEVELVPLAGLAARLRAGDIDHSLVAATLWRFLNDYY